MEKSFVTFGEIMLRLAPFNKERFVQAGIFQATYGGGEANVAVSLALLGNKARFVTRLPDNPLGQAALNYLRGFGVDTTMIVRGGPRLGIYFFEHGASIRPSKVVYDRAHSSMAEAQPQDFDWEAIFSDAYWFHITGITPALSPVLAEISLTAVQKAKEKGLTVSCDLNYRKKLWTRKQANKVMSKLVQFTDLIIANEEDAADIFGIEAETTDVTSGHLDAEHYKSVARQLKETGKAGMVAITLRESLSASDNNWSAMLYDGREFFFSRKYAIHLVDRVGGGDSFGAGLIHGLNKFSDKQKALEFAVAASALKQTIPGDFNLVTEDEVLNIVNGDLSGRVQR